MASSGSSSLVDVMDLLEAECPDITGKRRRRRRRNKHVNPTSARNLVKPPTKCKFRQPSLIDPDGWVVLVRCKDDETLHDFDEKLPLLAPKAGIEDAILRSHGFLRLIYVLEAEDTKARNLVTILKPWSAVFIGRTHKPFIRERTLEVLNLPEGIGYDEINDALDCQFPGKSLTFDVLISHDPRREPEREVLIVTHDAHVCSQLLNNGGLKLFDERLTFRCVERNSAAAANSGKWKKKKTKIVPESERQCFKCLGFGHMAESCDAPPRCKRCAGPHSHRECTVTNGETVVCFNCGSKEHNAASRMCPMRPGSSQKKNRATFPLSVGREFPSPPTSPENKTLVEANASGFSRPPVGSGQDGSGEDAGDEGSQAGVGGEGLDTPPSSGGRRGSESVWEDEEYAVQEESTEEPRDSSEMASPEGKTPTSEEAEVTPEAVTGGVSSTTTETKEADKSDETTQDEIVSESVELTPETETEQSSEMKKENDTAEELADNNVQDNIIKEETIESEVKTADKTEDSDDEVNGKKNEYSDDEVNGKKNEYSDDEVNGKKNESDGVVLYFTGNEKDSNEPEAPHEKTACAVASFFSDLFGAAEAPLKPLDGNFVATVRSLQESVYKDIASRHPRRGASSPRELKPAKKRRLIAPLGGAKDSMPPVLSPPYTTPEKVLASPIGRRRRRAASDAGEKASRSLAERRLRVLEQFFQVVTAILDIE